MKPRSVPSRLVPSGLRGWGMTAPLTVKMSREVPRRHSRPRISTNLRTHLQHGQTHTALWRERNDRCVSYWMPALLLFSGGAPGRRDNTILVVTSIAHGAEKAAAVTARCPAVVAGTRRRLLR